MVQGADGKWRTMANDKLYGSKMLLGALYRSELAGGLARLGYGIEKTHADGRFEIAGVPRKVIEAFSTRRAEIEAAVAERGADGTAQNQRLAQRAALMTRVHERDVDNEALHGMWEKQGADLGFDAGALVAAARERGREGPERERDAATEPGADGASAPVRQPGLFDHASRPDPAREGVEWAVAHLAERDAVFGRAGLMAAALAYSPGAASVEAIERVVDWLKREGRLHDAPAFEGGDGLTTDRALAGERETIALMQAGTWRARRRTGAPGAAARIGNRARRTSRSAVAGRRSRAPGAMPGRKSPPSPSRRHAAGSATWTWECSNGAVSGRSRRFRGADRVARWTQTGR